MSKTQTHLKRDKSGQILIHHDGAWAKAQHLGWDTGEIDGNVEGYHVYTYFDSKGRYLGPDQYGVEPIFAPA